jgi:hypothetical protein
MSTVVVPATRDAALRFDSWWAIESDDVGPYKNVVTNMPWSAMICAWSAICDMTRAYVSLMVQARCS